MKAHFFASLLALLRNDRERHAIQCPSSYSSPCHGCIVLCEKNGWKMDYYLADENVEAYSLFFFYFISKSIDLVYYRTPESSHAARPRRK